MARSTNSIVTQQSHFLGLALRPFANSVVKVGGDTGETIEGLEKNHIAVAAVVVTAQTAPDGGQDSCRLFHPASLH